MTDFIGKSFGRYTLLEQLGEGGMAIVYKAYDTRLERDVAIKVIRKGSFPSDHVELILKRFEREAKALARLSHPNIVKVYDYGDHEGSPYLVMEYLPSGTLKHKMGKAMPWQDAIQLIMPIADALKYAHTQKMIHRDVKPSNILLTESGQPMLTDFGIAKVLDMEETVELTGTSAAIGTPEYMAPEQATAKIADHRADIYALGVVLYEMVTGKKPYTADTPMAVLIMHARDPLPSPKKLAPGLPDGIEKILLKSMAKKPEDRYQSMDEMIKAFEQLLGPAKRPAGKAPTKLDKDPGKKSLKGLVWGGVILLGLVAVFAIFSFRTKGLGISEVTATSVPVNTKAPVTLPSLTATTPPQSSASFLVVATSSWYDTGIIVKANQTVKIEQIGGKWSVDFNSYDLVDGNGHKYVQPLDFCASCSAPSETGTAGMLMAKVGNHIYEIGNSKEIVPASGGSIFLMINDLYDYLGDNSGYLKVKVTVEDQ